MQTDRILLRRWLDSDAPSLFKYASDPDVGPRAGWPAHQSVEESLTVIREIFSNDTTWAIVLKETNEAIGAMGYFTQATSNIPIGENDCEVGYWVAKPYWNQGICTEALRLMLDYCINEKHFDNIWSDHFIGNPASGRVMEKCGFHDTGMLNRCSHLLGGDKDMVRIYKHYMKRFNFNTIGLFTRDNKAIVDFYTKAFGFSTDWDGKQPNVEMSLDGMHIILFPRDAFEQMTSQKYKYVEGFNGTMEIALDVPTFADVDKEYQNALAAGGQSVMPPTTEPWGQRTCYVADPDGNLIEIGSFNNKQ